MVPSGQQDHARVGILSIILRRISSDAGIVLNSLSIAFLFRIGFNGYTVIRHLIGVTQALTSISYIKIN